jgi:hypothetical protein
MNEMSFRKTKNRTTVANAHPMRQTFKLQMINGLNHEFVSHIDHHCNVDEIQFIESVSMQKSKNVVFCSHMGLGDALLNVGIINLLLKFYENVHYFCKREYIFNISTMFAGKPIQLIPIDTNDFRQIILNMSSFNWNAIDCIFAGTMKTIHPSLKSVIRNEHFNEYKRRFGTNMNEKTLYQHIGYIHSDVGVKWDVCLKYYDVHIPVESTLHYQQIQHYMIMFMHEIASTESNVDFSNTINWYMNLPNYIIICANRNVYPVGHSMHSIAQSFVNLPFMFYYDTIRHASDIHVVDSCFACIPFLLRSMNSISPKTFMIYARDKPYNAIISNGKIILL